MKTLFIIHATFCLAAVACSSPDQSTPQQPSSLSESHIVLTAEQEQRAGITTAKADSVLISTPLSCRGQAAAPASSTVRVPVLLGGTISSLVVLPGQRIRRGDLIATVEGMQIVELQREYLTTGVELDLAERQARRQERLSSDSIVARKVAEEAMASVQLLRIRKRALGEQLALLGITAKLDSHQEITRNIRIVSPINGVVTSVLASTGTSLAAGQAIVELVNLERMHVELRVYERDVSTVDIGSLVRLQTVSGDTASMRGKVVHVNADVRPDRTVTVLVEPEVPSSSLLPGLTVNAVVARRPLRRLAVPSAAVVRVTGHARIAMRVGNRTYRWVTVVTEGESNGFVSIVDSSEPLAFPVVCSGHRALLGE